MIRRNVKLFFTEFFYIFHTILYLGSKGIIIFYFLFLIHKKTFLHGRITYFALVQEASVCCCNFMYSFPSSITQCSVLYYKLNNNSCSSTFCFRLLYFTFGYAMVLSLYLNRITLYSLSLSSIS